jgi:hypothetical protein
MAQKSYLTTSPEKFQQEAGNGSSNTDSATDTGNPSSGGQNKTPALCLPLVTPPSSQSVASSTTGVSKVDHDMEMYRQGFHRRYDHRLDLWYWHHPDYRESGLSGVKVTKPPTSSDRAKGKTFAEIKQNLRELYWLKI